MSQRFIIEMGMGNDLHGGDYTKAASRALQDALHGASLAIVKNVEGVRDDLVVKVTIGVQQPNKVDPDPLKSLFPIGQVTIHVQKGGLDVGDTVVAQAAIEAFLPFQG
jgi:uncharacterized protein (TIGR02058 family)